MTTSGVLDSEDSDFVFSSQDLIKDEIRIANERVRQDVRSLRSAAYTRLLFKQVRKMIYPLDNRLGGQWIVLSDIDIDIV
jgi:hypothetical protein